MKRLLSLVGAILIITGLYCHAGEAPVPDLVGSWRSVQPEDLKNGTYGIRHFVFTPKTWSVTFIRYADRNLEFPIYSFYGEGPYELKGPSGKVSGAYNVVFRFSRKYVTLLTVDEAYIRKFRLQECGSDRYVPRDISEKGCSFFRSVPDYAAEYDLVKKAEDSLSLGARPADGNMGSEDRRPLAMGSPLRKISGSAVKPAGPVPLPDAESLPSQGMDQ